MSLQASPFDEGKGETRRMGALGPAFGIFNGCVLGLGCWAGLLWLAFG